MLIALGLMLAGVFLTPLWDRLLPGGITIPYLIGLALMGAGCCLMLFHVLRAIRDKRKSATETKVALLLLAAGAFYLGIEGVASAYIMASGKKMELFEFRRRQLFEGEAAKVSHPFLILTNNPNLPDINELGFLDRERSHEKPEGTIRIACLGASTSEDGYPYLLEEKLKEELGRPVEVINFGNAGWTTAQSLINYVLNVKYYQPDYVIIHHAANDYKVRGYGDFRTDYAHAFQPLAMPCSRWDASLLRYTNGYTLGKYAYYKVRGINPGLDIYQVIQKPIKMGGDPREKEWMVFQENIREIARAAESHGAKVILTTMPYSRKRTDWGPVFADHMRDANQILRGLAPELPAPLLDLDQIVGDAEENFIDPVHLAPGAIRVKVDAFAGMLGPMLASADAPTTATQTVEDDLVPLEAESPGRE